MNRLVEEANRSLDLVFRRYKNPVFMCSFGKDSMVLLDLLCVRNQIPPVLFHRDPWFPEKYRFADEMIRLYGLEMYDYAPSFMTLWEGKEIMAYISHYQVGYHRESIMQVPKNILPPEEGKKWVCGLKEVLKRPTGTFNYPWDVAIVGHKSSDKDSIAGEVPLHCDVKLGAGLTPDLIFPLRNWTDDDVWEYIQRNGVSYQKDRYHSPSRSEFDDKTTNSDYSHVCIACCDSRSKSVSVMCPKLGYEVSCVPSMVPYSKPSATYFGAPPK